MDFILCKVTFGQVDTCHHQCLLANAVHISSHASRVQQVQTTPNTAYIVGHTIFLTLYSVGKLDEK
jgi:hypothetical protein